MNSDACVRLLTEIPKEILLDVLYGKDSPYKEALDYAAKIISQNIASAFTPYWVTICGEIINKKKLPDVCPYCKERMLDLNDRGRLYSDVGTDS